jgi:hypothetical protein
MIEMEYHREIERRKTEMKTKITEKVIWRELSMDQKFHEPRTPIYYILADVLNIQGESKESKIRSTSITQHQHLLAYRIVYHLANRSRLPVVLQAVDTGYQYESQQ